MVCKTRDTLELRAEGRAEYPRGRAGTKLEGSLVREVASRVESEDLALSRAGMAGVELAVLGKDSLVEFR